MKEDNKTTRILASDMDDSMIQKNYEVTPLARENFEQLSKSDVITGIFTGQTFRKVLYTFQSNRLSQPDIISADMGSVLYNPTQNKIINKMLVPNKEVLAIVNEFFRGGGEKEFIRISTGEKIIATDCPIVDDSFKPDEKDNLIKTPDISINLNNDEFVKVVLMGKREFINELEAFASRFSSINAKDTGESSFGKMGYDRLEIVRAGVDKGVALNLLIKHLGLSHVNVLGIGDEQSDIPLAQSILSLNQCPTMKGSFAIIDNGTEGGEKLKKAVRAYAKTIGCLQNLWIMPSVQKDGAALAINKWLN
jgi:HAD superfamily hydrolase (TIGR01484 family)